MKCRQGVPSSLYSSSITMPRSICLIQNPAQILSEQIGYILYITVIFERILYRLAIYRWKHVAPVRHIDCVILYRSCTRRHVVYFTYIILPHRCSNCSESPIIQIKNLISIISLAGEVGVVAGHSESHYRYYGKVVQELLVAAVAADNKHGCEYFGRKGKSHSRVTGIVDHGSSFDGNK